MNRNKTLSFEKPEHLQKARKDQRKPEVIYNFYKKLKEVVIKEKIDDAMIVFNADKSGFGNDPSRLKGHWGTGNQEFSVALEGSQQVFLLAKQLMVPFCLPLLFLKVVQCRLGGPHPRPIQELFILCLQMDGWKKPSSSTGLNLYSLSG
ncbi:hypothetical protein JTB14_022076 [Gonioctena quinquepunctata]|nr:hypothetical protein JTB14_022076 [Gonioctena quinquepunctata]